ncbi:MAG TPA: MFS transporter [bacterium]|nr:MFS transporter [bacterium]
MPRAIEAFIDPLNAVVDFFRGPDLPAEVRGTYRRHLSYVIFDAAAAGILANAPVMAIKGMGSPDWQMALQLSISSIGMFLIIHLGGVMAVRRKMPFVLGPGAAYAICSLLMALTDNVLAFLILLGCGSLFEVILRPAVTAIIRLNYPVEVRGAAAGEIRKWSSITFLLTGLCASFLLDRVADSPRWMIKGQMIGAAALSLIGYWIFSGIKVKETLRGPRRRVTLADTFTQSWRIISTDARFRRYLAIGFLYCFGGLAYVSFVPVFLTKDLHFGYVGASVLIHILPSTLAFISTGLLGQWIDRVSTWKAWSWIRLGWGIDPIILALTPLAADAHVAAIVVLPVLGRLFRGAVMGGSWILWWQLAVNHFAPPGGDTTRYMGLVLFVNGLSRLAAPLFGALVLAQFSVVVVLLIGGSIVLLTSALSAREYARERNGALPPTMADFEGHSRPEDF